MQNKKLIGSLALVLIGILVMSQISKILYVKSIKNQEEKKYAEVFSEYSYLDIEDENFECLNILDKELEENYVFLTGEYHETVKATELNFYLLKYFVKKAGVKYILLERSYTDGLRLNEYLETGNEGILKELKQLYSNNYLGETEENYKLIKEIYNFNETLGEEEKISFIGLGSENNHLASINYLKKYIPKGYDYPQEISKFIEILNSCNYITSNVTYKPEVKLMRAEIQKNEKVFKEYYKEEYFNLTMSLENLSNSFGNLYKDLGIYNNFKKVYEHNPTGKYFGQFASFNIQKNTVIVSEEEHETFAGYLNKFYKETRNKVLTINYEFLNSKTSYFDNKKVGKNYLDFIDTDINEEIFPLNKRILIFQAKENKLPVDKDSYKNYEGFDYGILISNSEKHTKIRL